MPYCAKHDGHYVTACVHCVAGRHPAPRPTPADPMKEQVGGTHYKGYKIQPVEYSMANNLDALQHTVVKYVTRFRDKGGIEDLNKAKHAIDMLIAYEEKNGTKLR